MTKCTIASIILGIVSIGYSVYSSHTSSKELFKLQTKLEATIDNVSVTTEEIRNQQTEIQELLPELNDVESQNEKLTRIERMVKMLQTTLNNK